MAGEVHADAAPGQFAGRFEPARLVELAVACEVGLWNDSEDLPASRDHGAVVQPSAPAHRGAEHQHAVHSGRHPDNVGAALLGLVDESLLAEEVGAGVAGDAEFREGNYRDSAYDRVVHEIEYLPGVGCRVGHMHPGHRRRHSQKAVILHKSVFQALIYNILVGAAKIFGAGMLQEKNFF